MAIYSGPLQALIDELGRLPGVGPKSAQRITFHLLKVAPEDALPARRGHHRRQGAHHAVHPLLQRGRGRALRHLPRRPARRHLGVRGGGPRDIVSVEKTGEFSGRYHVLQGALNPIEGIGPDQLRVRELLVRVEDEGITEVILCTNPTSRARPPPCTWPAC